MAGFSRSRPLRPEMCPSPRSLLDQLLCDMQSHLDEMERMRVMLFDAYPALLSPCSPSGGSGGTRRHDGGSLSPAGGGGGAGGGYRFCVDVAGFSPEELWVQLDERRLTVGAKREQKCEVAPGCVSHEYRELRKELHLPADADLDALACNFAPDGGRLRIEAPRTAAVKGAPCAEEKTVPIPIRRGPAAVEAAPAEKQPARPRSPEKAQ